MNWILRLLWSIFDLPMLWRYLKLVPKFNYSLVLLTDFSEHVPLGICHLQLNVKTFIPFSTKVAAHVSRLAWIFVTVLPCGMHAIVRLVDHMLSAVWNCEFWVWLHWFLSALVWWTYNVNFMWKSYCSTPLERVDLSILHQGCSLTDFNRCIVLLGC